MESCLAASWAVTLGVALKVSKLWLSWFPAIIPVIMHITVFHKVLVLKCSVHFHGGDDDLLVFGGLIV